MGTALFVRIIVANDPVSYAYHILIVGGVLKPALPLYNPRLHQAYNVQNLITIPEGKDVKNTRVV